MNISTETYRDRVAGCWAGKCLGGAIGMPFEGVPYQPEMCPETINVQDVPNDDLELQLVWLIALERHGINLTHEHLAEYWLNDIKHGCDEYSIAIRNMRRGIMPPESGCEDNFFADGMGAAIRSEIWAAVFPGRPDAAAHFASIDASVDHWGDGVWSEVFLAMAESYLFIDNNIATSLRFALDKIPATTRLAAGLNLVFELYAQKCSAEEAKLIILQKLYHYNFTDCIMNLAILTYALLWGDGDFIKTILLAVNCGRDTDCTAATCGAFLGLAYGSSIIPQDLMQKLSSDLTLGELIAAIHNIPKTLDELTERTIALHKQLEPLLPQDEYPAYQPFIQEKPRGFDRANWLLLDDAEHDIDTIKEELLRTGTCPEELKSKIITTNGLTLNLSDYAKNANMLNLFTFLEVSNTDTPAEEIVMSATADVGMTLWLDKQRIMNHHSRQMAIPSFHRAEGGAAFSYPLHNGDKKLVHIKLYSCLPPLRCTLMFGNQFNDHLDGFKMHINHSASSSPQ